MPADVIKSAGSRSWMTNCEKSPNYFTTSTQLLDGWFVWIQFFAGGLFWWSLATYNYHTAHCSASQPLGSPQKQRSHQRTTPPAIVCLDRSYLLQCLATSSGIGSLASTLSHSFSLSGLCANYPAKFWIQEPSSREWNAYNSNSIRLNCCCFAT